MPLTRSASWVAVTFASALVMVGATTLSGAGSASASVGGQPTSVAAINAAERTEAATTAVATAATCARQPDWHLSCVCPSGYQVQIRYNAVLSPSYMWWGPTLSQMYTSRGETHVLGPNPVIRSGTGIKYYLTNRSVAYFSSGGTWMTERISWLDASCVGYWKIDEGQER